MESMRYPRLFIKTTMKRSIFAALLAAACNAFLAQTGEIRGRITDNLKEPVPFATIRVLQDDHLAGGTQSDEDGNYLIKPLTPGNYDLVVQEPGHITQPVKNIKVVPNEATYLNVKMGINALAGVTVTAEPIDYSNARVDQNMYIYKSLDAIDIERNAGGSRGDIASIIESVTSEVIVGPDRKLHFRGARDGSAGFFVDGVRTMDVNFVPGLSIENITVFTGGVPAMYGDVTSGVVIITTKSYFSGLREKNMRNPENAAAGD
jgi:hypothetical protein